MDEFTTAYIQAALWSSTDPDDDDTPLDSNYNVRDFDPETLAKMGVDCARFQADNADLINDDNVAPCDSDHSCGARAGHDFWLTRNGHGCGFWDGGWIEPAATKLTDASKAFGEIHLYVSKVGNDDRIFASEG